jgi:hypothetical protein
MIYICNTDNNNKKLEKYIQDFINKKSYKLIGIDFEFNRKNNKREIALCQIIFINDTKDKDIFLFYPPNINKNIFEKLLISDNIIKILHGGESLDMPYLFDNIINKNNRNKFLMNLHDTKYLCEYYNAENNIVNGKCRIYDLLLQRKVITISKYNELMDNDKKMGNIWEININVKNMSNELILYCVGDVLYLPDLYNSFPKNEIYTHIIQEISCVNFLLRYEKKIDNIFTDISKYNLNKIDNLYTYNDVYITVFYWLMTNNIISNMYQITYFKKFIEIIIKTTLYNKLNNKSDVPFLYNKQFMNIIYNSVNLFT